MLSQAIKPRPSPQHNPQPGYLKPPK
ncbi:hypothetical protein A2U01_0050148, partial [Trifolium medium]|nr:hypothetical protein [Trifolium medium]